MLSISEKSSGIQGDVDNNGKVDIIDALMTAQFYVGIPLTSFDESQGDVNSDGMINIIDALMIARHYVGHRTATYTISGQTIPYYLDPQTDFKYYLKQYITGTRARGVIILLVTPTPRNSAYCTGGNGTAAYAQAVRELGVEENVPVLDLNAMSVNYLKAICPAPQPENFFLIRADGTVDGTHFQENGARILAGFIAQSIKNLNLPLMYYLK